MLTIIFTVLASGVIRWNDYKEVRKLVERNYAYNRLSGLQKVCRAFDEFKECFSASTGQEDFRAYQACTEQPLGLLLDKNQQQRTQYDKTQAQGYVKIIAQFDFACGAGLGVFAERDDCMASVFNNRTADLEYCQDVFDYKMVIDPTNICYHQAKATICYRETFAVCGPQSGWFGCEYERTGTEAIFQQCTQNFCIADTHEE